MSDKYFQSLTFNSGFVGVLKAAEPNSFGRVERQFIQYALRPEGVKFPPNFHITLKVTAEEDCYIGTLFSDGKPFLSTAGARTAEAGKELWDTLQSGFSFIPEVVQMKDCMPNVPYTADVIFPYWDINVLDFIASGLSGSLSIFLSQFFLFPESVSED